MNTPFDFLLSPRCLCTRMPRSACECLLAPRSLFADRPMSGLTARAPPAPADRVLPKDLLRTPS